jgi:hypothetical protein
MTPVRVGGWIDPKSPPYVIMKGEFIAHLPGIEVETFRQYSAL